MINSEFVEQIILKGILKDKKYCFLISRVFETDYFENSDIKLIYDFVSKHLKTYKEIPSNDVIVSSVKSDTVKNKINNVNNILDFDPVVSYDYLIEQTNEYLKQKAIRHAILESVDIIEKNKDLQLVRDKIENALTKDIKFELGLDYWGELRERLARVFIEDSQRIKTYYPSLDEMLNGGLTPDSLSVLAAITHGGKSIFLANFCARMCLNGKNVVLFTLEMSQDAFAQRFDSIFTKMDINRMYKTKENQIKLVKKLSQYVNKTGNLLIKEFPTGSARVLDFRIYLNELEMRGIKPDIIVYDYLNLLKAVKGGDDLYIKGKNLAEESRALSFEYNVPVLTVTQLNRRALERAFCDYDLDNLSESFAVAATCDFFGAIGIDENDAIYKSEISMKILKNRFGGRIGEILKFYWDQRSLSIYDATELQKWIEDAKVSGDERQIV